MFGESITCDHMIFNADEASHKKDRVSLIVLDGFSKWMQAFAAKEKTAEATAMALKRFLGSALCKHIYSDNSGEIEKACEVNNWDKDHSQPHRPETNGIAEEPSGQAGHPQQP